MSALTTFRSRLCSAAWICSSEGSSATVANGLLECVEEREVTRAVERRQQAAARRAARTLERADELPPRRLVVAEPADLLPEPLDQHVEVADRAERAPEPAQLGAERLGRLRIEQVPARPEEGPQPPRRHAQLVELLRVGTQPRAGIVREHALGLLPEPRPQNPGGRAVVRALHGLGLKLELECLEDLRPGLPVGRARTPKRLLQPAERLLVAVEQLDLELLEAPRHPLMVEHGDGVVDDLGAVGPDPLAPRAQARDRHQRGPA